MTTLEIISRELPYYTNLCMADAAKHYGKDFLEHIPKEFQQAQREAISRFVIEVMRQSRLAYTANPSEPYVVHVSLMLMKVKEQLDAKDVK